MANQEHVEILKQGVEAWNRWRVINPWTQPDLNGADLSGTDLSGTNLIRANLREADLSRADLSGADLSGADLSRINLSEAYLQSTMFAYNDLTVVRGLDTIIHRGSSTIDFDTVTFASPGPALAAFLRGTGSSEYLIEALSGGILPLKAVRVKVFISFVRSDEDLCQHLKAHLSLLRRLGIITLTHEAVLAPEIQQWKAKANVAFQGAHVILLLISAPFLASQQAWKEVIEPALHWQQEGVLRLIPIILRPTVWRDSPLGRLQALPTEGKPVTEWGDIHTAFTDVTESIGNVVRLLHAKLTEHATKRRERDLLTANIILNRTRTAGTQYKFGKQKESVQQAENAYREAQARLVKAQQLAEALQADLTTLTGEYTTLHDQTHALDTQIPSIKEVLQDGMT